MGEPPGASVHGLLQHRSLLEPELIRILSGDFRKDRAPGAVQCGLREWRALERRWRDRERFLAGPAGDRMPDALGRSRGARDAYVESGLRRFRSVLRERAVVGLAAIGSPAAIDALRRAGVGGDEPLRRLVAAALARHPAGRALPPEVVVDVPPDDGGTEPEWNRLPQSPPPMRQ